MDEANGQKSGGQHESDSTDVGGPGNPINPQKKKAAEIESSNAKESTDVASQMPKNYWKRLLEEKPDRHIELLLTFAITFFAAVQWITSCQNNKSTTTQTGQLITAAKINACAAQKIAEASQRNAAAAESFSTTSGHINDGIGEAVKKLRAQALATQRSADAAKSSADTAVSANRPWIVPDTPPRYKRVIEEASLEFHNAGKSPAVSVFSTAEYFSGELPHQLRTCDEMERDLKKRPIEVWQYQGFVTENGRYETGLAQVPAWVGQQPIAIHGCVWYTDVLSNTEKSTEFFFVAFQGKFGFPTSEGVSLFYLSDRPFIYK